MIKNNGCCSLEHAKKLKELGVKQESLFFWCEGNSYGDDGISMYCGTYGIIDKTKLDEVTIECFKINPKRELEYYSAFTVAELGELLPANIQIENRIYSLKISKNHHLNTFTITYTDVLGFEERNMADCLAKMLIWLKKNKKI